MPQRFWILLGSSAVLLWLVSHSFAIIEGRVLYIERAISVDDKQKGLSNRESLGEYSGMLFEFNKKDRYVFWMKDMRFPIDIIWIDGDRVVALDEHAQIPSEGSTDALQRYYAPRDVDKVLEIPAGSAKKWGISVNSKLYAW